MARPSKNRKRFMVESGFRSGLEDKIAKELEARGIKFDFEEHWLDYTKPHNNAVCSECGSEEVSTNHRYLPDFYLPDYGFYIETKGRFLGSDRRKHTAFKKCNPDVDIRFVFQRDDYLTRKKKQTYTGWCDRNGFKYFVIVTGTKKREEQLLPEEWFDEDT